MTAILTLTRMKKDLEDPEEEEEAKISERIITPWYCLFPILKTFTNNYH